jgi:hypothetical protein
MLSGTRRHPDEVIAAVAPAYGAATVERIAINAVMAGCLPDYMPVLIAAARAVSTPAFNLSGVQATTNPAAVWLVVNGPAAVELGVNGANNCLGPGSWANATLGRALRLILQNVGGALPGDMDRATQGQPGKYTFCCAENEQASPWEPLHVERGFAPDDDVATVVGSSGIVEVVDSCSRTPGELAQTFAQSMLIAGTVGGAGLLGGGQPLIVLPPELAVFLHQAGCSKAQFKQ